MKTLLYNTTTNQPGPIRTGHYTVDGKRPELPSHLVELTVTSEICPKINETQKLSGGYVPDFENKEYRYEYTVHEKTHEEIMAENSRITKMQGLLMAERSLIYDSLIAAIDGADRQTQITFENAPYWDRPSPMIESFGQALGMTEAEMDEFFINANKIIVE